MGAALLGVRFWEFLREGTYFQLREIRVAGDTRGEREELLARLDVRIGDNLLMMSKQDVRRRVEAHPWVRRARVGKHLPDVLSIEIEERTPVALLSNARESTLYGLDEEGCVLPQLPRTELAEKGFLVVTGVPPAISFPGNLIEFPTPEPVMVAVRAVRESRWLAGAVAEIHWDPEKGYLLYPRRGISQLILGKQRVRERVSLLDRACAFLTSEAIEAQYVDVRFEAQGAVFRSDSLSEAKWLAQVDREKTAPGRVAAALGGME